MIVNPKARTVLCYGDSNTNGQRADGGGRYAADVRWTGQLQKRLGNEFYVIEDGLGGRTTNLEHPDHLKASRHGFNHFKVALETHWPLDVVVLMLGTNDMKHVYNRSAADITTALAEYCDYIQTAADCKLVLVSPAYVALTESNDVYDQTSVDTSHAIAPLLKQLAEQRGLTFADAATVVTIGADGLHWSEDSQSTFATLIEETVRTTI